MNASCASPSPASLPRLLSLVLPRLPTDRLRRMERRAGSSGAQAEPLVIVGKVRNALVLTAVDAVAERAGLVPGLPLATARAMLPALRVVEADPAADAVLLDSVADWAERYTPFVGLESLGLEAPGSRTAAAHADGLVLDVTGSAHLFGGEDAMMADLLARLARSGLAARAAISGTRAAARAVARFAQGAGAGLVIAPGGEARATLPLPIEALGLDAESLVALGRLGLKSVADLASRPRGPLAARFGMRLLDRLDRTLGRAEEPVSPRRPLPACLAERRFAEPIGHEDDVQRSILALATELAVILERRGEGARRLELTFFRTDGAVRRLPVESSRPLRDPAAVLRLYRERLAALADPVDPGFGFDVMRLAALATERFEAAQTGLDGRADMDEQMAELADRLGARFGVRRVLRIAPQDTHHPERAAVAIPAQRGGAALALKEAEAWEEWRVPEEPPARPLRLLDPPERIEAVAEIPDGPPIRFRWRRVLHAVRKAEGPERIAPEWWRSQASEVDGNPEGTCADPALTRDYFRIEDESGRRFWLYREGLWQRETQAPRWFLHGLFA